MPSVISEEQGATAQPGSSTAAADIVMPAGDVRPAGVAIPETAITAAVAPVQDAVAVTEKVTPESPVPAIAEQVTESAASAPCAASEPYRPASAMDLLESAVGNLNLMANDKLQRRQALGRDHESGQVAMPLAVDDASLKAHRELEGSLLETADAVFSYIDALRGEVSRVNADSQGRSEKSGISAAMLSQRTLMRSMSQEAVARGLVEHDYRGTEVTVSEALSDEADPFAGADPAVLSRADVPLEDIPPADFDVPGEVSADADHSLSAGEISGLVGASRDDVAAGDENESAGPREADAVSPGTDGDPFAAPLPEELSAPFIEGRREDETPEQMLLRVQQAALAQLEAEDSHEDGQTAAPGAERAAASEAPAPAPKPAPAVPGPQTGAEEISVSEMDDPFGDPEASHAARITRGTPFDEVRAEYAAMTHELAPAEHARDVVGEVLRRALASDAGLPVQAPAVAAAPTQAAVAPAPATASASAASEASSDEEVALPDDPEYGEDADDEDEPDETIPETVSQVTEGFYAETPDDGGRGAVSMPDQDGDPEAVPLAERQEVERVQQADRMHAVRALEADDFMEEVARTDPWFMDFKAAGYDSGAAYAALCASSRRVDPGNGAHWIIVMSRSFEIFVLDPNFLKDLTARFSNLKGRPLEIAIQQCDGIPQGSPRDLAAGALAAKNAQVRDELARDGALARILKVAGARFEDTGVTVCTARR